MIRIRVFLQHRTGASRMLTILGNWQPFLGVNVPHLDCVVVECPRGELSKSSGAVVERDEIRCGSKRWKRSVVCRLIAHLGLVCLGLSFILYNNVYSLLSIIQYIYYALLFWCTSTIHFPPIFFNVEANSPFSSIPAISSPPPMLFPLTRMLGTVRRPVLCPRTPCRSLPNGCWSSSTTYGAGTMEYSLRRMAFAFAL